MRKSAFIGSLIFISAAIARAQVPTSGNVFFGYSYENAGSSALDLSSGRPNLQGWEASLEGKIFPVLGIVADFSGHYGSESATFATPNGVIAANATGHETEVLFGPRVSVAVGKFRPFGEVEIGVGHINTNQFGSQTSFATAIGGGLDYRLFRPVAWRFQGDYVSTRFFNTTQNDLRLSTGIVIRF